MFNKYICSLMSIQKQFWLSRLLLHQRLTNGEETVSLLCRFGGDPLHTHPKRHEFFSSTHQSLRKDNNSDHRIFSLERGPKSSNLKGCNQATSGQSVFLTNLDFNFFFRKFYSWLVRYDGALSCTNVESLFRYIACLDTLFVSFAVQGFRLHIFLGTIEIK